MICRTGVQDFSPALRLRLTPDLELISQRVSVPTCENRKMAAHLLKLGKVGQTCKNRENIAFESLFGRHYQPKFILRYARIGGCFDFEPLVHQGAHQGVSDRRMLLLTVHYYT